MSKNYDYDAPYKIYYIEYDENKNEIDRGVFARSYKYYGAAWKKAHEYYGDRQRYKCVVAKRDPWVDYSDRVKCDICNKEYDRPETHDNFDMGDNVWLHRRTPERRDRRYLICPKCFDKIDNFITRIAVGTDEMEAHNDG